MSKKLKIIKKVREKKLFGEIEILDESIIGKSAEIYFCIECDVNDSRKINSRKRILVKKFIVSYDSKFEIDLKKYEYFTYKGKKISINLSIEIIVDDAIFFDTKISERLQAQIGSKPGIHSKTKDIIDPKDNFNLLENMKAIPPLAKFLVVSYSIIGAIVIILNMFLGIHDQFVLENQVYFYSHYDSDGDTSSPFFNALAGSGTIGVTIWGIIKFQLKKYMTFFFKNIKFNGKRDEKYYISDIIGGKSRVDLKNVELRIVACNMEKGQYTRGSGSNKRTVSFSEPVRALIIYSKSFDFISAGENISSYFTDQISFEMMYKILYPKQKISSSHGLDIHWEVQLITDKFIDQELIGKNNFKNEYFLEG